MSFVYSDKKIIGDIILTLSKTNGLKQKSEILAFQIRSLSKNRLINRLGQINDQEMNKIEENLNEILKYYT